MEKAGKKNELSWLNLLFCAMVLYSHSSSQPISALRHDSWQFAVLYLLQRLIFVSVYGFFFISGIKLTLPRAKKTPLGAYYKSRVKTILLPYLLANGVYYAWFCGVLRYFPPRLGDFLGYVVRGDLSAPFYFVVTLVQFTLLMPLLRRIAERWSPALVLPFALGVTWLSGMWLGSIAEFFTGRYFAYSDRIFTTYLFYYLAGCYVGQRYEAFVAAIKRSAGLIVGAFVLFGGADLYFTYALRVQGRSVPFLETVHYIYLPSGILLCFLIALRLDRPLPKLLARVDKASFLVYLYHSLFISALDHLLARAGVVGELKPYLLRLAGVYILVPALCILWQTLYSRVRIHAKNK